MTPSVRIPCPNQCFTYSKCDQYAYLLGCALSNNCLAEEPKVHANARLKARIDYGQQVEPLLKLLQKIRLSPLYNTWQLLIQKRISIASSVDGVSVPSS